MTNIVAPQSLVPYAPDNIAKEKFFFTSTAVNAS